MHKMIREKSAGAILFIKEKEPLYLLLHYESGHWDFPKGHVEAGETDLDTVRREVKEEAGITNIEILQNFKEKIHYFYKMNNELMSKDVVFYLAKTNTKDVKLSFEHIGFAWVSYEKAMEKLTYKNAKDILQKAHEFLKSNKSLDDF